MTDISAKEFRKFNEPRRSQTGHNSTLWLELRALVDTLSPEMTGGISTLVHLRPMLADESRRTAREVYAETRAILDAILPHVDKDNDFPGKDKLPVSKEAFRAAFVKAYHLFSPDPQNPLAMYSRTTILAAFSALKLMKPTILPSDSGPGSKPPIRTP